MESTNNEHSFIQDIQALWTAEKMLTDAMPLMIQSAAHLGLQKNLALHLAETRQHKQALALILKQMGLTPDESHTNADMQAILDDGQKAMQTSAAGIDAAIIAGAKAIEKYEMTMYQKAAANARSLGYEGVEKRLQLTFEEERQANSKMNFLQKELVYKTSLIGVPE